MNSKKPSADTDSNEKKSPEPEKSKEVGGFENRLEPTRYGDWDVNGRCSDF